MSEQPTQKSLEFWLSLAEQFRHATPSSPAWFPIIDHVVGNLLAEKVKDQQAALQQGEGK